MNFGISIFEEVLIGTLVGFVLWLLPLLLRIILTSSSRRQLIKFFGVTREHQIPIVYFSTVFVTRFGSKDFKGEPRSFFWPAIPDAELRVIQPLSRIFESSTLNNLPAWIRVWLSNSVHWSFSQIQPELLSSPENTRDVRQGGCIITVGSQYYNSAGTLFAETLSPLLQMDASSGISVVHGANAGEEFHFETNGDIAIVEKLYDRATDTTGFILAGMGIIGTIGAVHYLFTNWHELYQRFDDQPFAICLRFANTNNDPNTHLRPTELFSSLSHPRNQQ